MLRPRSRFAVSPLRDGRCEGGLPRVPREAKASLPREVTFGIAAGDVGPEGRVERIGSEEPRIRVARVADLDALAEMCEKLENYHADLGGPEYRRAPGWKETGGASHAVTSGIGTASALSPNSTERRSASSWGRSSHGRGSSSTDCTDTSTTCLSIRANGIGESESRSCERPSHGSGRVGSKRWICTRTRGTRWALAFGRRWDSRRTSTSWSVEFDRGHGNRRPTTRQP